VGAQSQFPSSQEWEFWVPSEALFALDFEVCEQQALRLTQVGGIACVPTQTQQAIKDLEGRLWDFPPECELLESGKWGLRGAPTYKTPLRHAPLEREDHRRQTPTQSRMRQLEEENAELKRCMNSMCRQFPQAE
jgi:hypothetical protein